MQKSLLCKLSLRGERCRGNFSKSNVFVKASAHCVCVDELSKPKRAQVRKTKAFRKQQKR